MSRGRAARAKGLNFEREVSLMFRPMFPKVRRQLEFQYQDAKGIDLQGCDPFKVQCKRTKKYVPLSTISEIQCNREFGDIPVLIAAGDNQEPMACLPLDEFIKLVEKSRGHKREVIPACTRCSCMVHIPEVWRGKPYCTHCYGMVTKNDYS